MKHTKKIKIKQEMFLILKIGKNEKNEKKGKYS
jgi:hypothetical protein